MAKITRVCPICQKEFFVKESIQVYCSNPCRHISLRGRHVDLAGRFWNHVKIGTPEECWEWQASKHPKGYGQIMVDDRLVRASRLAYELHYGPIPLGFHVLHKCDNPPCCNWHHLWVGTNKDNHDDKRQKGRAGAPKGEHSPRSKLNAGQVRQIRKMVKAGTTTKADIARSFGVTPTCIRAIITGETWKHI